MQVLLEAVHDYAKVHRNWVLSLGHSASLCSIFSLSSSSVISVICSKKQFISLSSQLLQASSATPENIFATGHSDHGNCSIFCSEPYPSWSHNFRMCLDLMFYYQLLTAESNCLRISPVFTSILDILIILMSLISNLKM